MPQAAPHQFRTGNGAQTKRDESDPSRTKPQENQQARPLSCHAAGDKHSADRERAQPGRTWAAGPETPLRCLAFMNDLDIVAVRIKYPCRIIAGIVFKPGLRRFLALASSGNSRFVKSVYL